MATHGGVYIDIDVAPSQPLDNWLPALANGFVTPVFASHNMLEPGDRGGNQARPESSWFMASPGPSLAAAAILKTLTSSEACFDNNQTMRRTLGKKLRYFRFHRCVNKLLDHAPQEWQVRRWQMDWMPPTSNLDGAVNFPDTDLLDGKWHTWGDRDNHFGKPGVLMQTEENLPCNSIIKERLHSDPMWLHKSCFDPDAIACNRRFKGDPAMRNRMLRRLSGPERRILRGATIAPIIKFDRKDPQGISDALLLALLVK
jgi:hypothetical protein